MFSSNSGKSTSADAHEPVEEFRYDLECLRELLWPVSNPDFVETNPLLSEGCLCETALKFKSVKLDYPDDVKTIISESKSNIEVGSSFDIIPLLSCNGTSDHLVRNNGDRVDLNEGTFEGKDVMVCCFPVPMFRQYGDSLFNQSLATICHDKYNSGDGDFEMVVVAKMNELADYESVFDHFMSAFPPSCFVVPFDDPKRRDYICHYLDVTSSCKCLIVDRSGTVMFNKFPKFAAYYGAEAFPYTPEILLDFTLADRPLWECCSTTQLEELLGCTASDVLDKINLDGSREEVSISELKKKVVGLFLVYEGSFGFGEQNFIFTLSEVYEQCRAQNLEFEIVVVYLPYGDCLDPEAFQAVADSFMKKHNISWWRMPFNNTKCRRLWRLCIYSADKLVMVGPNNKFVDPYGREIMTNYGVEAYPFIRELLVHMLCQQIRALTLQSLLVHGSRNYVLRGNARVAVSTLQPKSVLLYFALDFELLHKLKEWYGMIKEDDPNFEVILVLQNNADMDSDSKLSELPWLICPFNSDHSASLKEKLFEKCAPCDTLIGFGIDGCVRSIQAQQLIELYGSDCFPFVDNLREEVLARVELITSSHSRSI